MMENWGCQGGNTETAYMYIAYNGGVSSSDDYPYSSFYGSTGDCDTTKKTYGITVTSYHSVQGEESMKNYVMGTGPLSICIDASDWSTYQGGIVTSCGTDVNHCVQVVGVDTENGYWIVRNSWGTTWGEQGYIYLKTDQNTCVIDNDPTYADVSVKK
jgi:C1A family cysteine protease